jgi:Zn-dependent protease with chaperone function
MDFFAHQQKARANTRVMLGLFGLALLCVALLFGMIASLLASEPEQRLGFALFGAGLAVAVIAIASVFKTLQLRSGGGAVARELGATLVNRDTQDPQFRRLLNVVDEMAIAAGMAVPEVYVLTDESGINAFAAGYSPADAAVCVTSGALQLLSRDELQGVVAHEFSHILNGDMRLNIRLMGVLFGLLVLSIIGREILSSSRFTRRAKDAGPILMLGIGLLVLGYVGLILGRVIKAAVSRAREFDADASAVQFTRVSHGLAGALKKIGGLSNSQLQNQRGEEVAHMCIAPSLSLSGLFATHPPIADRILRLDPHFNHAQLERLRTMQTRLLPDQEAPSASQLLGLGTPVMSSIAAQPATLLAPGAPQNVINAIAMPGANHLRYGARVRADLPAELIDAAHSRSRAPYLLLALLIVEPNAQGASHQPILANHLAAHELLELRALTPLCAALNRLHKLPLACLAFPSFKQLDRHERARFDALMHSLVQADQLESVFEYCLLRVLQVLDRDAHAPAHAGKLKLVQCQQELVALFGILAQYGHADFEAARAAFAAGMQTMGLNSPKLSAQLNLSNLDNSLDKLTQLAPAAKRQLIFALTTTMQFDGQIHPAEAELLRAICLSLQCPLPPLLESI